MCDSKNKTGISFAVGALVGAGAGFFLSTKTGRKYLKEAWKKVEPYIEDVRNEIDEVKVKGCDAVEDAFLSVKDFAQEKVSPKIKTPVKKTFFKGL
ncbi:MAG: YtxH domain-containing protein [Patescibacteria group bacterium]